MADRHGLVFYQQVAEVYLKVIETRSGFGQRRLATNRVIAETWGVPKTTADGWVRRARSLGLIGDRPKGCSHRCGLHCPESVS